MNPAVIRQRARIGKADYEITFSDSDLIRMQIERVRECRARARFLPQFGGVNGYGQLYAQALYLLRMLLIARRQRRSAMRSSEAGEFFSVRLPIAIDHNLVAEPGRPARISISAYQALHKLLRYQILPQCNQARKSYRILLRRVQRKQCSASELRELTTLMQIERGLYAEYRTGWKLIRNVLRTIRDTWAPHSGDERGAN